MQMRKQKVAFLAVLIALVLAVTADGRPQRMSSSQLGESSAHQPLAQHAPAHFDAKKDTTSLSLEARATAAEEFRFGTAVIFFATTLANVRAAGLVYQKNYGRDISQHEAPEKRENPKWLSSALWAFYSTAGLYITLEAHTKLLAMAAQRKLNGTAPYPRATHELHTRITKESAAETLELSAAIVGVVGIPWAIANVLHIGKPIAKPQ
ncbi:hypothetical protein CF336_g7214 [Tilletia laevis]|nr:hypothetical protein CF336_g7214 [Tilletia laevis]